MTVESRWSLRGGDGCPRRLGTRHRSCFGELTSVCPHGTLMCVLCGTVYSPASCNCVDEG